MRCPSGWGASLGIYNLLNTHAAAAEFWYVDRLQSRDRHLPGRERRCPRTSARAHHGALYDLQIFRTLTAAGALCFSAMTHLDTEASTGCAAPVSHDRLRGGIRLSVLTMLVVTAACGGKVAAPPAPQPVSTITIRPQPTSLTQEYPAQLEASNTVEIRPQVGGILYRQGANEGTPVKRGQTLFEIDPQPYSAALAQAQAGLAQAHAAQAQAERDLARARPLTAIDALSQKELDAAVAANDSTQSQVKAQEAAVRTAELNLGYTQVRSPIDGVMSRALIRIGGVVTAYTTLLTTVYQTDPHVREFQRRRAAPAAGSARARPPASTSTIRVSASSGSCWPTAANTNSPGR